MTAFIREKLPEHMRITSGTELLYLHMLSGSEIVRTAEWLAKTVDSVALTCAEPTEAQVGRAGHATLEVRCHYDTQGGRKSGEKLADAVRQ